MTVSISVVYRLKSKYHRILVQIEHGFLVDVFDTEKKVYHFFLYFFHSCFLFFWFLISMVLSIVIFRFFCFHFFCAQWLCRCFFPDHFFIYFFPWSTDVVIFVDHDFSDFMVFVARIFCTHTFCRSCVSVIVIFSCLIFLYYTNVFSLLYSHVFLSFMFFLHSWCSSRSHSYNVSKPLEPVFTNHTGCKLVQEHDNGRVSCGIDFPVMWDNIFLLTSFNWHMTGGVNLQFSHPYVRFDHTAARYRRIDVASA